MNVVGLCEGDISRNITECQFFCIFIRCCIILVSLENSGGLIHKVPVLVSITRRVPDTGSSIFGCIAAQCKYSAHCVRATRWVSRTLQLGRVE